MKFLKYSALLAILIILTGILAFQSCKKDDDSNEEVTPTPPVYVNGEGEIGALGGTITIEDPQSSLYGIEIKIPEGALNNSINIKISEAPQSVQFPYDSTSTVVKLEPSGLIFNSPIEIIFPIDNNADTNYLRAYYFSSEQNHIECLPTYFSTSENVLITEIEHFSYVTISEDGIFANVAMYYDEVLNEISIQTEIYGIKNKQKIGLEGIKAIYPNNCDNAMQVINEHYDIFDDDVYSYFIVKLYRYRTLISEKLGEQSIIIERHIPPQGNVDNQDLMVYEGDINGLYEYKLDETSEDQRELFFGGKAIDTYFNTTVEEGEKYFATVDWVLTYKGDPLKMKYGYTNSYSFNGRKERVKKSQMIHFDPDENNNNVLDEYEESSSNTKPTAILEVDESIGTTNTYFHFDASDSYDSEDPTEDLQIRWDFDNDGNWDISWGYDKTQQHKYNESGTYTAKIEIKDTENLIDDAELTVDVYPHEFNISQPNNSSVWNPGEQNVLIQWQSNEKSQMNVKIDLYKGTSHYQTISSSAPNTGSYQYDVPSNCASGSNYRVKISVPQLTGVYGYSSYFNINKCPNPPQCVFPPNNSQQNLTVVALDWTCTDPENDDLVYDVHFGTTNPPPIPQGGEDITESSFVVDGLQQGITYFWQITAKDDLGNETEGSLWKFSISGSSIPIMPTNIYAGYWPEENGTGIYWQDNSSNEDGFKIYRAVNHNNSSYSLFGTTGVNSTFYSDNSIDPQNYYCYKVTAYNSAGESDNFEFAIVPKTPISLQGEANDDNIELSWDNPSNSQAAKFFIYRSTNSPSDFSKVGETNSSTTQYTDNNVSTGNEYYYRIEAIWQNSSNHVSRSLPTQYIGPFEVTNPGGTGEPCPGIPTVSYQGQVYNTVLIGSQCWLKENLNVGTRINGSYEMTDNGTIEKYCYDDDENNCDTYGGLYQWDEMMQYTTTVGTQGICPNGWHVPSDEEWKILEGTVDTQYGVGDPEWDDTGGRGYDAGKRLKSTTGWYTNSGTDAFGFTALPGGNRSTYGSFFSLGNYGDWWSSAEYSSSYAWRRYMYCYYDDVSRYYGSKEDGYSVRCLKD